MKILRPLITFILLTVSTLSFAEQASKAILITGASSGLGLKMTELLSSKGYIVYAGARKQADLDRLQAMPNVESIKLDVTKDDEIAAAVATVQSKGRGLYGLVNNAGVAIFGPLIEVADSEIERIFNINVRGPARVTKAFAPLIIESKGRIMTTGSIAGVLSGDMYGPYSMSKHAVEAYTDSLASEMKRFGVKVSVVEPGNYGSQIGASALKRIQATNYWPADTLYKEERAGLFSRLPMVEKGPEPDAVAEAVLHAMSSETPKLRYMVVDQQAQADATIRKALREMLELNHQHKFSYDQATLVKMLQQELSKLNAE